MKVLKTVLSVLFLLTLVLPIYSQGNTVVPKRTPEQEAATQTEKLQQELNLNQDQAKQVFEINIRYARERQISNKRSEALERIKNKDAEIKQVLSPEQNDRLQTKRYERTYLETNTLNRNRSINSSGFRSPSNFRSNQTVRVPASTNMNFRNNNRPVNPDFQRRNQQEQPTRRRTNSAQFQNNRRTETVMPLHKNSFNNRSQPAPNYTPRRTQPSVNPNRK